VDNFLKMGKQLELFKIDENNLCRNLEGMPDHNNSIENLWHGMPDFKQEKKEPYAKIIFRFENEEDLQQFAKMINQKLTSKTKSSWHPFKPHRRTIKEVWIKS